MGHARKTVLIAFAALLAAVFVLPAVGAELSSAEMSDLKGGCPWFVKEQYCYPPLGEDNSTADENTCDDERSVKIGEYCDQGSYWCIGYVIVDPELTNCVFSVHLPEEYTECTPSELIPCGSTKRCYCGMDHECKKTEPGTHGNYYEPEDQP